MEIFMFWIFIKKLQRLKPRRRKRLTAFNAHTLMFCYSKKKLIQLAEAMSFFGA
jgi:hypothetical protein